jgi:hypothetical protein
MLIAQRTRERVDAHSGGAHGAGAVGLAGVGSRARQTPRGTPIEPAARLLWSTGSITEEHRARVLVSATGF